MTEATLGDVRARVETLASDRGEYYLVCGRTGVRPVPAVRLRFDSRETARAAARATERYRTILRRYDPQLPRYDVIVCQELAGDGPVQAMGGRQQTVDRPNGDSSSVPASDAEGLEEP